MMPLIDQVKTHMEKRGFSVFTASTADQARNILLGLIPDGASIGIGGSMTIRELDVTKSLSDKHCAVYWHWDAKPENRAEAYENAMKADVYLSSANAVSQDGQIVNIDGTGNRVASTFYGPPKVIFVISAQKLVDGGLNTCIARIKKHACPPNARRLNLDTPCAHTGICRPDDCGNDCMCRVTNVLSRPPRNRQITVILVEEALGY